MFKKHIKPLGYAMITWAGLMVFVVAFIDLLFMPYLAGKFRGTVNVPNISGLSPEEADDSLSSVDLVFMLDSSGEYSPDIKAGNILRQRPSEGTIAKKGRRVWVTISKGLKSVKIPELKGNSVRQAEITLQQLGLKLGEKFMAAQPGIPLGVVFESDPPAHSEVEINSPVTIFISSSRKTVFTEVKDLIGLTVNRAQTWIELMDMTLGTVEYVPNSYTLPNTVIEQKPGPGSPIKKGGIINLKVAGK